MLLCRRSLSLSSAVRRTTVLPAVVAGVNKSNKSSRSAAAAGLFCNSSLSHGISFSAPLLSSSVRGITTWQSNTLEEWKKIYKKQKREAEEASAALGEADQNKSISAQVDAELDEEGSEVVEVEAATAFDFRPEEPFEKVVEVRRVAKVVTGGKMVRFRVTLICGDERGTAGWGVGKAANVIDAIRKARNDAINNYEYFRVADGDTILYEVRAEVRQTRIQLWPLPPGAGLRANMVVGSYLQALGVENCAAKVHGSHNVLNTLIATRKALNSILPVEEIAMTRGKRIVQLQRK